MNIPSTHPLFQKLTMINLPSTDYAVFGSAPMWLHGLKELNNDVDIIARGAVWQLATELGEVVKAPTKGEVIKLFDGTIEVYNVWAPGDWDTDELIDTAEEVDGIRFVNLENVKKWKINYGREKDLQHVKLIDDYLNLIKN
jgi:hypothetical protein